MQLRLATLSCCLLGVAMTGCSLPVSFGGWASGGVSTVTQNLNLLEWGADGEEPRSGTPERIVATWSDTIRQTAGKSAERGFGGRIYFYDRGEDPIEVEGRLVVYAFDEEGRAPTDHKPTKRYVFPADQLANFMSESEIGPSYSVWLPWGSVAGTPTQVSLIARFEPVRGGGLVVSDQSLQRLPGQGIASPDAGDTMLAIDAPTSVVRQAGFQDRVAIKKPESTANDQPKRRLSTTTIRLPK